MKANKFGPDQWFSMGAILPARGPLAPLQKSWCHSMLLFQLFHSVLKALSKPGRLVVQLLGGVQLFATTPWTVVH